MLAYIRTVYEKMGEKLWSYTYIIFYKFPSTIFTNSILSLIQHTEEFGILIYLIGEY